MRNKKSGLIFLLLLLVSLVLVTCGSEPSLPANLPALGATATPVTPVKSTIPTATVKPASTLTPVTTPTLAQVSPSPTAEEYITPVLAKTFGWVLKRSGKSPILSQQEAMRIVFNSGMSWGLGGTYEGKQITLEAAYGLIVTSPNSGKMPVQSCTGYMTCAPSGEILEHFENRAVWMLDYGNIPYGGSLEPCTTAADAHELFVVDEETRSVIGGGGTAQRISLPTPSPHAPRLNLPITPVPTPSIGQPFIFPPSERTGLTLFRVAALPLHSPQDVLNALQKNGIEYALGGEYKGYRLNLTIIYGLGTRYVPANSICPANATCSALQPGSSSRTETRLMWVVDYGNMPTFSLLFPCLADDLTEDSHSVFFVDAQTLEYLGQSNYSLAVK